MNAMKNNHPQKLMQDYSQEELIRAKAETHREIRITEGRDVAYIKSFTDIQPIQLEWLWLFIIAIGKLTLFVGDPGIGKSQAALFVATRLSIGMLFPDNTPCPIGATLIVTREDDEHDTIRHRLDVLEADLSNIYFFKNVVSDGKNTRITLKNIEAFKDAIDQVRLDGKNFLLLIIDPLESFLDGADANKNTDVRDVLEMLIQLAAEERFAILGIQHLNKSNNSAAYRVSGSIAFTALARSVWIFLKDKRDDGRRLFLPLKNNLAVDKSGFAYHIESVGNSSRIVWDEETSEDIDEIMYLSNNLIEKKYPEQNAILKLLEDQFPKSMRTGEIAKALDKKDTTITNLLNKLRNKGAVENPAYGYWQLSSSSSDSPKLEKESVPSSLFNEVSNNNENGESIIPFASEEHHGYL
jgi:hypothetical protein